MDIEDTNSVDIFGLPLELLKAIMHRQNPFLSTMRDSSFKTRILEFVNTSIIESMNQFNVEDKENENVSKCCRCSESFLLCLVLSIIDSYKDSCERILDDTEIPDSNEVWILL